LSAILLSLVFCVISLYLSFLFFFFNDPAPTEIYTLSLHDALPISIIVFDPSNYAQNVLTAARSLQQITNQITSLQNEAQMLINQDRKSTRLNSSHLVISYAVFCLKKKKNKKNIDDIYTKTLQNI